MEFENTEKYLEEFDAEEFEQAMDEFCRLVWDCSQLETDAEKQEFAQTQTMKLTDVILNSADACLLDEEDKLDIKVLVEESCVMFARVLNRVSEQCRSDFRTAFCMD